jgi:hypothetical protein
MPLTIEEKAARWDALMSCERIRVIGSAKLGDPEYQHIGIELWSAFDDYEDISGAVKKLETFVEAMLDAPLPKYDDNYDGPVMATEATVHEADDEDCSNVVSIATTDDYVYHFSADKLDALAEIAGHM